MIETCLAVGDQLLLSGCILLKWLKIWYEEKQQDYLNLKFFRREKETLLKMADDLDIDDLLEAPYKVKAEESEVNIKHSTSHFFAIVKIKIRQFSLWDLKIYLW